jgi:rhomboid protease GluP
MPNWRRIPGTSLLLAAIAVVFVLEIAEGGSENAQVLYRLGANIPDTFAQGQWWRLVAAMFLHIGFLHLVLNGWALFQLGSLFEVLLGTMPMLGVYFVTGIASSLASVVFTHGLSAGASGAIFGLLGALVTFLLRHRRALMPSGRSLLTQLLGWAALNVVMGFTTPGIDNAGHLGGCAVGLLLGLMLRGRPLPMADSLPPPPLPQPPPRWPQFPQS